MARPVKADVLNANIAILAARGDTAGLDNVQALDWISQGVEEGEWSEESHPEEFAELRKTLLAHREWYLENRDFMKGLRLIRDGKPAAFWWLWIEDLHG